MKKITCKVPIYDSILSGLTSMCFVILIFIWYRTIFGKKDWILAITIPFAIVILAQNVHEYLFRNRNPYKLHDKDYFILKFLLICIYTFLAKFVPELTIKKANIATEISQEILSSFSKYNYVYALIFIIIGFKQEILAIMFGMALLNAALLILITGTTSVSKELKKWVLATKM